MADTQILDFPVQFQRGFYPSAADVGPVSAKDAVVDGRNMLWVGPGKIRSARGLGVGPSGIGGPRLYIINNTIATINDIGAALAYRDNLYYLVTKTSGAGIVNLPGVGTFSGTGGRLQFIWQGQLRNAGLAAPTSAPVLVASTTPGRNISAKTSCQITRIRSTAMLAGGSVMDVFEESNGSPPSASVAVSKKKIKFTNWPAAGTGADMHDAWGVYVSPSNSGDLPGENFLFLRIVTEAEVAAAGRAPEWDWSDQELQSDRPPTLNDPPPTGELMAGLGNVIFMLNTRGGLYYSASRPGFPGAFSPFAEGLMPSNEKLNGTTGRAQQNELYAWSDNSLLSFLLTGDEETPIYARAIWPNTGIKGPMGGAFADLRFYCFVSQSGCTRIGQDGQPDTAFALPVRNYIESLNWNPALVSVGHDPVLNAIVYSHKDDALVYMQDMDVWCVPVTLNANTGQDTVLLTFQGQLVVGKGAGLFLWEGGLVDQNWFILTAKQDYPKPSQTKTLVGYRVHARGDGMTFKLYVDDADPTGTPEHTLTDMGSGLHYTLWDDALLNVPCINWQLRLSGTKKDQEIHNIDFQLFHCDELRDLR